MKMKHIRTLSYFKIQVFICSFVMGSDFQICHHLLTPCHLHVKDLPMHKKYQRAETALKTAHIFLKTNLSRRDRAAKAVRCEKFCDMPTIANIISLDCAKGNAKHECLRIFRENPGIVRNFRVLWCSLPRSQRMECLIQLLKEAKGFRVMGVRVCQQAFMMLSGVAASTLQRAREFAAQNHQTVLSKLELGGWLEIKNSKKNPRYLES